MWNISTEEMINMRRNNKDYFDPTLSYEITGYLPINETEGLDFDPTPFTLAGDTKLKRGKYCEFPRGTKAHKDFWVEQKTRCEKGYQIGKYRVTGDHYFFLNFHPLLNVLKVERAGEGRTHAFGMFWVEHYKYTHYLEMCEILGRDVVLLKSRGVGLSELGAATAARLFTTTRNSKCLFTAFAEDFLLGDGILPKIWTTLDYLNEETEGGFRHLRQKQNSITHKRASHSKKDGTEYGHMAEIIGLVIDNPRKLRGGRYERIYFEEAGSFKSLMKVYTQAEALIDILGKRIGTRIVWGTGGDEGVFLEGLEKLFTNPRSHNVLPYKNNYNEQNEYTLTGYFIPAYNCVITLMDKRGYTTLENGKNYYNNIRSQKLDPEAYIDYCAEYCFTPQEALSKKGQNTFDQMKIAEQYTDITLLGKGKKIKRGRLFPIYADKTSKIIGARWSDDPLGDIFMTEEPLCDATGRVIKNLYVSGIDGIDIGASESSDERGSKFATLVKKRQIGLQGNEYVCMYLGRPQDIRHAYETTLLILMYYDCMANLEETKIGFRTYLREKGLDNKFLMRRPQYALNDNNRVRKASLWGTPGTERNIKHGLELIGNYINDYCYNVFFKDMLVQMRDYAYEAKRKYDIIAAMIMCEIADEEMYNKPVSENKESLKDVWQDIGRYVDQNGIIRYGVIPNSGPVKHKVGGQWIEIL